MAFEDVIMSAIVGLYALVVTLYYRIGKLEQRLKDLIAYYFNNGSNKIKKRKRHNINKKK